jgi:hypothetical protein
MMTSNDLESQFRLLMNLQLARHEDIAKEAIANILKTPVPDDVKILLFETQSDWYSIPIVAFSMDDASPDEVYFDEPFSGFLIDGGGPALVIEDAIDQDKFEDAGIDTFDITHEMIAGWFASIWKECGGDQFARPAYIGAHDRDAFVDLRSGTACTSGDIWPE